MPVKDTAREAAFAAIRAARTDIVGVCREIHDDPEPAGEERRASERQIALLTRYGFECESGVAGLPTAFRATRRNHDVEAMRKGLRHGHVGVLVHADADPALGHVDGTPTGLAAGLGAAVGLAAALGDEFGTVTVIGYPGDSALPMMARAGVFDEFDAVFGAQPASFGEGFSYTISRTGDTLAARSAIVSFSSADSANTAKDFIVAVNAAASELTAPSQIDASRNGDDVGLSLTAGTSTELSELSAMIQRVADGFADASVTFGETLDDTIVNRIIARRVKTYADTLGFKLDKAHQSDPGPATGWGSVSYATPAFVLNFPFATEPVVRGDQAFAVAAARSESYDRALDFATCICLTGLDVLRDMQIRSIADDQLVKALDQRGISRQHRRWLGVHPVIREQDANRKDGKNGKKGPKLSDFRMVRGPGMRDN